jgi:hypothetical protein
LYGYKKSSCSSKVARRKNKQSSTNGAIKVNASATSSTSISQENKPILQSSFTLEQLINLQQKQDMQPKEKELISCSISMIGHADDQGLDHHFPEMTTVNEPMYTTSSVSGSLINKNKWTEEVAPDAAYRRNSLEWDALDLLFAEDIINPSDDPFEPIPIGSDYSSDLMMY